MSDTEREPPSGEEEIDEQGRNPTQQRMDEEGESETSDPAAFDVSEPTPHQGEEGQEPV